jgi:mitochondrial fission protein ELM1
MITDADGMVALPKVWVLSGTKVGGNGQLTSLANALSWPYETKQLVYNLLNRCPNLLLGASLISLDCCKSSLQANAKLRGVPSRAKGAKLYLTTW